MAIVKEIHNKKEISSPHDYIKTSIRELQDISGLSLKGCETEKPLTNIVMASAVLSLLSSSSTELSDEKDSVKFLDCTICNNSSYQR